MVARYEGGYCIVLRLNGITGFALRVSLNTELIRGSGSYRIPKFCRVSYLLIIYSLVTTIFGFVDKQLPERNC